MARKRIELGADVEAKIVSLMARGGTADSISKALGISMRTAGRRMQELRSRVSAVRLEKRKAIPLSPAPLPESDEEVPEDTPLEQIGVWLKMAKEEADAARLAGETENMVKTLRLASTLLALQQKATPVAPPDPNDNPDMVAAAVRVRKRLRALMENMAKLASR